ncbi:MAG: DNA polymerase III subunit beta [Deltaproteobacteria bacterium]|nr:DNA polymerase III subunit beta [Deltaproteobacteria bacterium]
MKALVHKGKLLEGLEIVKDAASKQNALPILKGVKITADDENLYLYTTNLTMGIRTRIKEAKVVEPGAAGCDTMKLLSIMKELPDTEVILRTEENGHVRVECENINFKLIGLREEEFPPEVNPGEQNSFPIGPDFFSALVKVKHAASKEESRYNLNGVYFDKEIVATDGHRMSLAKKNHPLEKTIVPIEFINTIIRLGKNGNESTRLCRSENTIFIYSEDLTLHCRLIDGLFPDYESVVPMTHQRAATMDTLRLYHAVKRILLMSDRSNHIRFDFNGDHVLLTSAIPEAGEACEKLEIRDQPNPSDETPFVIGFGGKYLLDVLEVLKDDQVTFLMSSPDRPLKIENKDSVHIIMPIRLP